MLLWEEVLFLTFLAVVPCRSWAEASLSCQLRARTVGLGSSGRFSCWFFCSWGVMWL